MMHHNKNKRIILIVLLIIIGLSSLITADDLKVNSAVLYNPKLVESFNNPTLAKELINQTDFVGLEITDDKIWAKVIVRLKDNFFISSKLSLF